MADKFNTIGARLVDIERGFSYVATKNPFVLEIGCGNGRDALEILKRTDRFLGIDISESMIELAKRTAPEVAFAVADIEQFAFPPDIDLIFSFASLLHSDLASIDRILSSASNSLTEGGVFYISLKYGEGQVTKTDEFGIRTFYFYKPDDIHSLMRGNYTVLWEDVHDLRGQKWFSIALRRT